MTPEGRAEDARRRLAARLGGAVALVWTRNRSVYLSVRPGPGGWVLRLHEGFRSAPPEVWGAVGEFLATGRRGALGPARDHFDRCRPPERRPDLEPRGRAHHLATLLEEVRALGPFGDLPPVALGWGRRVRPGRRHLRLGSYRPGVPGVIRVHPVLDHPAVPAGVVAQVVHHELVHHYLHWTAGAAAGRSHGRRFRELESAYPGLAEAQKWQARELGRLVERWRK